MSGRSPNVTVEDRCQVEQSTEGESSRGPKLSCRGLYDPVEDNAQVDQSFDGEHGRGPGVRSRGPNVTVEDVGPLKQGICQVEASTGQGGRDVDDEFL